MDRIGMDGAPDAPVGEEDPADRPGDLVPPRRSWLTPGRGRAPRPTLVHWIDDRGSVVRLISSEGAGSPAADAHDLR